MQNKKTHTSKTIKPSNSKATFYYHYYTHECHYYYHSCHYYNHYPEDRTNLNF